MNDIQNIPLDALAVTRVDDLARNCNQLDETYLEAQSMTNALNLVWARLRRELAARVCDLALTGYVMSPDVRQALGGEFAEAQLYEAAIEKGWVVRPERGVPVYIASKDAPGALDALVHCLGAAA